MITFIIFLSMIIVAQTIVIINLRVRRKELQAQLESVRKSNAEEKAQIIKKLKEICGPQPHDVEYVSSQDAQVLFDEFKNAKYRN